MNDKGATDDASDGDLGLGDGLKPGGLPTQPCDPPDFVDKIPRTILPAGYEQSDKSSNSGFSTPEDSDDEFEVSLLPIQSIQALKHKYSYLNSTSKRCTETCPSSIADDAQFYDERYIQSDKQIEKCGCPDSDRESDNDTKFPVYADVPYGTSIRQQKELFYHSIDELRKKMTNIVPWGGSTPDTGTQNSNHAYPGSQRQQSCEEIAMKLAHTMQEVEDLKIELQTCEQRLDSKYRAIEILKKQAQESHLHKKTYEKMSKDTAMKLAQEINRLQFELNWRETSILESQQVWAQRFDRDVKRHHYEVEYASNASGDGGVRVTSLGSEQEQDLGDISTHLVTAPPRTAEPAARGKNRTSKPKTVPVSKYKRMCQENKNLMEVLESRTEELRKVSAQKIAVERENDELLALLDIQERAKYEQTRSVSAEENYCTFSSTELAILGACRCRVTGPDPCGCACAAANLKKEIVRMKEEVQQYKNRRDEAFQTVDAYRKAFEEQLQRNKALTIQLANLSSHTGNRSSKTKSAFRWLIGTLNDDEISDSESSGPGMTEQELISYLTEMLHEKKEVLAHQKLASQILADKVKVLEDKLMLHEKEDPDVFH